MPGPIARVFALEVDGKPMLVFEAFNATEAQQLCKERWLREDLISQKSNGSPLCSPTSKLSVRYASVEESAFFNHAAHTAKPSDDMVLAYLVEPDSETQPD
jgi:hypothetical protein